ncbi:NADPH-dependent FMN reductase [Natronoglycomyces albus]|uniref:NAD(P)H-dependent oxidoreductase n=1 Tax=Natronoglycomyces albus TaxID=2811108 RepID=A0A895XN77_9ACTN|nr:NADPH-dependent FMN reductase [Natronoglycomyces albus]QSB04849.1 NAD(P)H-dependent oxidoreductase [Natronoglycomyces albus]
MATIAVMSGSIRRESVNSAVIATITDIITRHHRDLAVVNVPIAQFPHFSEDIESAGIGTDVQALKDTVGHADALVISSPAYNGFPPGVLKNALDWLSRPGGNSPLTGLPVAIASASPGRAGGENVQPRLREVLTNCGARVVECDPVAIGGAFALERSGGCFTDPEVRSRLDRLVAATLAALPSPEPCGSRQPVPAPVA